MYVCAWMCQCLCVSILYDCVSAWVWTLLLYHPVIGMIIPQQFPNYSLFPPASCLKSKTTHSLRSLNFSPRVSFDTFSVCLYLCLSVCPFPYRPCSPRCSKKRILSVFIAIFAVLFSPGTWHYTTDNHQFTHLLEDLRELFMDQLSSVLAPFRSLPILESFLCRSSLCIVPYEWQSLIY